MAHALISSAQLLTPSRENCYYQVASSPPAHRHPPCGPEPVYLTVLPFHRPLCPACAAWIPANLATRYSLVDSSMFTSPMLPLPCAKDHKGISQVAPCRKTEKRAAYQHLHAKRNTAQSGRKYFPCVLSFS